MLYLDFWGIFKILIWLPFLIKPIIWTVKCPKTFPICWEVIGWGVFFRMLFLGCTLYAQGWDFFQIFNPFITQLIKDLCIRWKSFAKVLLSFAKAFKKEIISPLHKASLDLISSISYLCHTCIHDKPVHKYANRQQHLCIQWVFC